MGQLLLGLKFTVSAITFIVLITGYYCVTKYSTKAIEERAFAQLLFATALLDFLGIIFNLPFFSTSYLWYPIKVSGSLVFINKLIDYYLIVGVTDLLSVSRKQKINWINYTMLVIYFLICIFNNAIKSEMTANLYKIATILLIVVTILFFVILISMMLILISSQKKLISQNIDKVEMLNYKWMELNTVVLISLSLCYPVYILDKIGWIQLIVQILVLIILMLLINQNLFKGGSKERSLLFIGVNRNKGLVWQMVELGSSHDATTVSMTDYKKYYSLLDEFEACEIFLHPDFNLDVMYNLFERKYDKRFLSELILHRENMCIQSYIQRLRIQKAEILITSIDNLSLKEIAFKTGFSSQAAFSRSFSSVMGITPSEYKSKLRIS
ncbi:MAG: helix-turn-helix domain-containing protein [Bacteroidales bacterium]